MIIMNKMLLNSNESIKSNKIHDDYHRYHRRYRAKDMNYITYCSKQQLVLDLYSHYKAAVSLPFSCALLTALCDPSRHSLMGSKVCWGEYLSAWCSFNRTHQLPPTAAPSNLPRLHRRGSIVLRDSAALLTWSDASSPFLCFTLGNHSRNISTVFRSATKDRNVKSHSTSKHVWIYISLRLARIKLDVRTPHQGQFRFWWSIKLYHCFDVPLIQQKEINSYIKHDFIIWMTLE